MGNEIGLEVRKGEFMLEKKGTKNNIRPFQLN